MSPTDHFETVPRAPPDVFAVWGRRLSAAVSTEVLVAIALALVWALGHPFSGVDGDGRIYMGRALADIDPAGVGRDMMFVMDGQSAFTIFRTVAKAFASAFGFGPTVLILTLVNIAVWFAAIVTFVRAMAPGRAALLVLATVFVLPRLYTGWPLFVAGESIPVPRPLAEAAVLFGLAALCHGRVALCAFCLVLAALFHPIMAAPGFGILLILLGLRDRRWFFGAAVLGLGLVGAGLLELPLASRLMTTIDPAWRAVLVERNPYLFVRLWPMSSWGPAIVRVVTIVLACIWLDGRARGVFLASLAIGFIGVTASFIFGDLLSDVLFVQAQIWRALWVSAVLAPVAAGLCLWRLPWHGAAGQIALACLSMAWLTLDLYPLAPVAAGLALAAFYGVPRLSFSIGRRTVIGVWAVCGLIVGVAEWKTGEALRAVLAVLPDHAHMTWGVIWSLRLATLPIMGLVMAWWRWPDAPATRVGAALAVVLGLGLLATCWDNRAPAQANADAAIRKPDLVTMLASRPGPVLWTDGDEAWQWLGRAHWNTSIQGSAIVFSRDLALLWHARADAVVRAGLADASLLAPLTTTGRLQAPRLDAERIARFCARGQAPAWIVAPLDTDTMIPPGLDARLWSPIEPRGRLFPDADGIHWRQFDRYAVIACADHATP